MNKVKYQIQAVEILKRNMMKEAKKLLQTSITPIVETSYINNARYCILKFKQDGRCIKYGVLFKKQFFHSFGSIFKNESGEGETINQEHFIRYFNNCNDGGILFVYQHANSFKIYRIFPNALRNLQKLEPSRVHIYTNNADGKKQIVFSKQWLEELELCQT